MAQTREQRLASQNAWHKARVAARAIAAGRVPGRIGKPPQSAEQAAANKAATKIRIRKELDKRIVDRLIARAAKAMSGISLRKPSATKLPQAERKARRRATVDKYKAANPEKVRKMHADSKRRSRLKPPSDPVKFKIARQAITAKRRLKMIGTGTPRGLTAVVARVWLRCGARCTACQSRENLELDHIIAVENGGLNEEANLQFLCRSCNRSKGTRDHTEWLASRAPKEFCHAA
jgi:5-methylcytosine-specific restriction endonuclease McrA